ncbi:DUF5707 domain-containing protein [Streptomyces sp. NPDC090306]|uniref:DUF5707 domain-containing protein n=1 Tax=unclassified Streptomyces TaxID=2593676 RepID=UPI0036EA676C
MSRRIALSVAAGVVVLAGAGTAALAYGGEQTSTPTLSHSTARYVAPQGTRDGSFTFTADVEATSGVASLKVLAWPGSSALAKQKPSAREMASAERAECEPAGRGTAHCVYTVSVSTEEARTTPRGAWHVSALATAKDGSTGLVTEAAAFTVG